MTTTQKVANGVLGSYPVSAFRLPDNSLAQAVVSVDTTGNPVSGGSSIPVGLSVRIVDDSPTLQYVGEAAPGSSTSAAVWRIRTIDTSSGTVILWADGTSDFTKIWDNYNGYPFS